MSLLVLSETIAYFVVPLHRKLLLATNNQAKVQEYGSLFRSLPFELVTLDEWGIATVVDEVETSLVGTT